MQYMKVCNLGAMSEINIDNRVDILFQDLGTLYRIPIY